MDKDWMSAKVIKETNQVYAAFSMFLLGVAVWDVLSTLWFEWQILTGRRKWRWPMLIYILARVAMVLQTLAVSITRNPLHEVPCQKLTFMCKFCDALGTCMSSLILVLRTRAVWNRNIYVTGILGILFVGQIVLWGQTFNYSKVVWNKTRGQCDVLSTPPRLLMIWVWAYTMIFDFIVLLFCAVRLYSQRMTTIGSILFRDGIAYFCSAFIANLIQTIMAGLQLNPIMNIIALSFALVVSVIAATTVFRNVFIAYDNFHGDSTVPNANSGRPADSGPFMRTGAQILFNHNITTNQLSANEIPLGQEKSNMSPVSVGKVIDVQVDASSQTQSKS